MNTSVAVIGCGYWGRNLVRNFHGVGALAAVCDLDEAAAAAQAETYGVPARSFVDILAADAIDVLAVVAPAAAHAELCRDALRAGKHVFVEKPLALRASDAEDLSFPSGAGRRAGRDRAGAITFGRRRGLGRSRRVVVLTNDSGANDSGAQLPNAEPSARHCTVNETNELQSPVPAALKARTRQM